MTPPEAKAYTCKSFTAPGQLEGMALSGKAAGKGCQVGL